MSRWLFAIAVFGSGAAGVGCGRGGFDAIDAGCPAGYEHDGADCVDIDECASGGNDCSADATCANELGSFTCACGPGFAGDGRTCERICNTVLVYDDCQPDPNNDCGAVPEPLVADDAATQLGLAIKYGAIHDQVMFRTLFDAGGFDLVIVESSLFNLEGLTAQRVGSWVANGGRAIVTYWDLDEPDVGAPLAAALDVVVQREVREPVPPMVLADPEAPVDLLAGVPSPLTFTQMTDDDGDEIAPGPGGGFVGARYGNGAGALVSTRDGRVVTFGFQPINLVYMGPRDQDSDGVPDMQEIYEHAIRHVCGY